MKRVTRSAIALLLITVMLFSACRLQPITELEPTKTPLETAASTIAPTDPALTLDPNAPSEADLAFAEFDREWGIYMLESDPSSLSQLLVNPKEFGIDVASLEMNLGTFSLEEEEVFYADMRGFSEKLSAIDKDGLSRQNRIAYLTVQQTLEEYLSASERHDDIYYEPLVPYVGWQSEIPLIFALYELNEKEDVDTYLVLLKDVPRFMGELLDWEQQRADAGIFMTSKALDDITSDLNDTIKAKTSNAQLTHFEECVNAIKGLTDEQKAAYIAENEVVMLNEYNAAFITLRDGLKALSGNCRDVLGASATGDMVQLAYFEEQTRMLSGANLTVEEAYDLLSDAMAVLRTRMEELRSPATMDEFRMDSAEAAAAALREMTYSFLPELRDHTVSYVKVPKELEDQFSPAAYLIPPIDDWSKNTVLVNKPEEDKTLYFTMAHEAYPGHLYQYNYQRALGLPLIQSLFHSSTYSEAWSQFGEFLAAEHSNKFPSRSALMHHYEDVFYTLFYSLLSILVNEYGYDAETLSEYYGFDAEGSKELFQICVDMPYYYMPYAFGYANILLLNEDYHALAGADYDETTFCIDYLNIGPTYFNILRDELLESLKK